MTTILAGDISVDCACARKPIDFDVTRFCTIKLNSNNFVTLIVCVYLPTNYATVESTNLYRETVAELSGFLESCIFDNLVVVGDFNVDFSCTSPSSCILQSFMESFNLHSVDQDFGHCISHTYEKSGEGGCVQSWLDHNIMISRHYTSMITDISCIHLADNFSDHLPLVFQLTLSQTISHSSVPSKSQGQSSTINWSTISEQNVEVYHH